MRFLVIIPARYASIRFPGKPLADLNGKPVIQHVYLQAKKAVPGVFVATDDNRIAAAVSSFGGQTVMTSPHHKSGTDRCAEAAGILKERGWAVDVVINLQGDEPFIEPGQLRSLMGCFSRRETRIATLASPLTDERELRDPNVVKLTTTKGHNVLYFSRSAIPYLRDSGTSGPTGSYPFLKHIGIYAYTFQALQEITALPPSLLEQAESLEQLRWIENGYPVYVALTEKETFGIDTPQDLERAREYLNRNPSL